MKDASIIPHPYELNVKTGAFQLNEKTIIVITETSIETVANYFNNEIKTATGFTLQIVNGHSSSANTILLIVDPSLENDEGYEFVVSNSTVTIKARKLNGLFYGIQTLLQLLPVEIVTKESNN